MCGWSFRDRIDEGLVVPLPSASRDEERLPVRFTGERARAHIRHPNLDRTETFTVQPLSAGTSLAAQGLRAASRRHVVLRSVTNYQRSVARATRLEWPHPSHQAVIGPRRDGS